MNYCDGLFSKGAAWLSVGVGLSVPSELKVDVHEHMHSKTHMLISSKVVLIKWILINVLIQCVLLKHAGLATGKERPCVYNQDNISSHSLEPRFSISHKLFRPKRSHKV